jgi:uncharacterized membrane protein
MRVTTRKLLDCLFDLVNHINMLTKIKKIFISGLITFLPLAVTVYILLVFITIIENVLGRFLKNVLPEGYYIPGYGFIATLLIIFIFGLLVNNLITATIIKRLQEKLTEIPLVKAVYSPLRDLINLFSKTQNQNSPQKVVLVHFSPHFSTLGLVTREDFTDINFNHKILNERIAVLILMSYGLGGYTILIDRSQVEAIDMPVEKAMSLAVTGWIKTDSN